ncbi:hypothetical protein V6N13_108184 [Hibiscus sabdariffa]
MIFELMSLGALVMGVMCGSGTIFGYLASLLYIAMLLPSFRIRFGSCGSGTDYRLVAVGGVTAATVVGDIVTNCYDSLPVYQCSG